VFPRKDGPFGVKTMGGNILGKYAPKITQNGREWAISSQKAEK